MSLTCEADERSLYYYENSCGREAVEVPAGEKQGENLLLDEVGVRVELGAKNHDKDRFDSAGEEEGNRGCHELVH